MSLDSIGICSASLVRLGAHPIRSFSEDTAESSVCSTLYPITRDAVLIAHPWSFSLDQAELQATGVTSIVGFQFAFALPQDLVRTITAGSRGRDRGLVYRIRGNELHTESREVLLTYQRRPSETEFPAYFIPALVGRLAADLCLPLTENSSRAELLAKLAIAELQLAKLVDSQQASPRGIEDFPLIEARFQ